MFPHVCRNKISSNCYVKITVRMFESQKGTDFRPDLHAVTKPHVWNHSFLAPLEAISYLDTSNCVFIHEIYSLHSEKPLNTVNFTCVHFLCYRGTRSFWSSIYMPHKFYALKVHKSASNCVLWMKPMPSTDRNFSRKWIWHIWGLNPWPDLKVNSFTVLKQQYLCWNARVWGYMDI